MMRPAMLAVRPGFRPPEEPFCAVDTASTVSTSTSRTSSGARRVIGTVPKDTAGPGERLYGLEGSGAGDFREVPGDRGTARRLLGIPAAEAKGAGTVVQGDDDVGLRWLDV